MSKPKYVEVKMKTQTLRVLMRLFGSTNHSMRRQLGIPDDISKDASEFYHFANKELENMGYETTHIEWRPNNGT